MDHGLKIALINPEIPQNTGNIGRLCVNTGTRLHLVRPLGFSLEDKYVKRAGLDYWPHLDLSVWEDVDAFTAGVERSKLRFFSTRGRRSFWDCPFSQGDILAFGNETSGLPERLYGDFEDSAYYIPMPGEHSRSYNLANSAAIVLFEALRTVSALKTPHGQLGRLIFICHGVYYD